MNFETFKVKFYEFVTDDPNFCVYNGIEKNLGDLPDPGKNKRVTNQGKLKMLNSSLREVKFDTLSDDEKVNYKLYELYLEQIRLGYEIEIDGIPQKMRMPMASEIISGPIFMLFVNDERDPKLRLVNIISRLEKVEQFIISYCRNISSPVKRWVDMEFEKLMGLPSFLNSLISWGEEVKFPNMVRLERAVNNANSSLKRYESFLQNIDTSKNVFLGTTQMNLIIKSRGINLSPDELHKISKEFTLKNIDAVEELRSKLIKKYELNDHTSIVDLQKFLNQKFQVQRKGKGFEYILNQYREESKNILKFIETENLFPLELTQEMKIIQTPDFMKPSIPAGAMMPPLAMREGVRTSIVYLTLSEELLDEHTNISIPAMMIHEGIPGHHLQFAWASNHPEFIRKIFSANDHAEGWTTMLEDYMLDIGYANEFADEMRFIGKRDIARIGARVAIDLYFMSGDKKYLDLGLGCDYSSEDPFVNAGVLLKEVTGFVDDRLKGELNWYSQESGYPLSYLAGNHLVWDLKDKFKKVHGEQMGSKELEYKFHEQFLKAGNMPVSLLEKLLFKEV